MPTEGVREVIREDSSNTGPSESDRYSVISGNGDRDYHIENDTAGEQEKASAHIEKSDEETYLVNQTSTTETTEVRPGLLCDNTYIESLSTAIRTASPDEVKGFIVALASAIRVGLSDQEILTCLFDMESHRLSGEGRGWESDDLQENDMPPTCE